MTSVIQCVSFCANVVYCEKLRQKYILGLKGSSISNIGLDSQIQSTNKLSQGKKSSDRTSTWIYERSILELRSRQKHGERASYAQYSR